MLLFSSIIITIILFHAIITIYIVLHIYLHVSENEGLADLYWVIGQSFLEKINSIYFQGISLRFQKCSFKNPNVLLRIQMFLISTISFIMFWGFSMFYQIFFSPQVKRWAVITYKHGIFELHHKLPKDLKLKGTLMQIWKSPYIFKFI